MGTLDAYHDEVRAACGCACRHPFSLAAFKLGQLSSRGSEAEGGPASAKFNNFMQVWPFMQRYTSAYSNIFELQRRLNELTQRIGGGVVGNVGYFGKQVSTYVM